MLLFRVFEKFELEVLTIELKKLLYRASENRREERKGAVWFA